jgi:hypothetical protein
MPLLSAVAFTLLIGADPQIPPTPDCATASACRDAAVAAAEQKDFETFHDLSWRAVQKGRHNDPELMLLLARAQSLSGRPLDALVMLGRIADLGVATDAATSKDFERVRALPAWPNLERRMLEMSGRAPAATPDSPPATAPATKAVEPTPTHRPNAEGGAPKASANSEAARAPEVRDAAPPAARAPSARPPAFSIDEAVTFNTAPFTPAGLAYDAVSRRFIVGDRQARKLSVVDEFSRRIANLAGAQATGFGEVGAIEIDPREGTLWVVTSDETGPTPGRSTLHKLQLISGRALAALPPPSESGATRLADVAVTPQGGVLVVDDAGRRVFQLRPRATALEVLARLGDLTPISIAPAPDGIAYVAHETGIQRVDLATGRGSAVTAGADVPLGGLRRIRWHRGGLVVIQKTGDAGQRAVQLRLNGSGRTVTRVDVLDPAVDAAGAAASVSGDELYYLTRGEGTEMIVRKVSLTRQKG